MDVEIGKVKQTNSKNLYTTSRHIFFLTIILVHSFVHSQVQDNQTRDCQSEDGRRYHGQMYTREKPGVCLLYKCDNGHEMLAESQCRDENGRCYRIGETRHHSQCVQQTCTMNSGYLTMKATTRECAFKNQCVNVNHVITDGCLTYRCSEVMLGEGKYQLSMELEQAGCPSPDNNSCLTIGQTIKCGSLVCDRRDNLIGLYPVKHICEDRETGVCYELGATWQTKQCVTLQCAKDVSSSNPYGTRTSLVRRGCPDESGTCHDPDGVSTFLVTVQGRLRQCVCQLKENSVQYSCMASDGLSPR